MAASASARAASAASSRAFAARRNAVSSSTRVLATSRSARAVSSARVRRSISFVAEASARCKDDAMSPSLTGVVGAVVGAPSGPGDARVAVASARSGVGVQYGVPRDAASGMVPSAPPTAPAERADDGVARPASDSGSNSWREWRHWVMRSALLIPK